MNMTTQNKLADALRALVPLAPFDGNHDDETRKGPQLKAARAALAEHDAKPAPTCPHCTRTLDGSERMPGLCASDDCPRHDAAKALRWALPYALSRCEDIQGDLESVGDFDHELNAAYERAAEALAEYPGLPEATT